MSLRIKHAGLTAGITVIAAVAMGAWLLSLSNDVRSAKAASPSANGDVDIAQQAVTVTDKQVDAFKILPAEA
ncbi:hypothetical protein ACSTGZ_23410, partial [Vibrio parahaemolyticus]